VVYQTLKNDLFFDEISKTIYEQLVKRDSSVLSSVMLNIERFEVGQSYVTAKVQKRYGENVTINIQGGRPGIELQASFFKMKEEKEAISYKLIQNRRIFARRLPVVGQREWLLIYEDALLELSVKDAYDELEVVLST
jgi:hypothetical protein